MTDIVLWSSARDDEPTPELRAATKALLDAFAESTRPGTGRTMTCEIDTERGKVAVLLTFLPGTPEVD